MKDVLRKAQKDLTAVSSVGVTNHALNKLRERLPHNAPLISARDGELYELLVREWNRARVDRKVELWWENIEGVLLLNHVFDLLDEGLMGAPLVALVREDDRTPGRPAYVSVLTASMAERSRKLGHWAKTKEGVGRVIKPGPIPSFKNTAIRDQLAKVVVPAAAPASLLDTLQEGLDTAARASTATLRKATGNPSPAAGVPAVLLQELCPRGGRLKQPSYVPVNPHPGERLREWLVQEGIGITDAAKKMKIPKSTLGTLLRRGTAKPDIRERIGTLTNNAIPAEAWPQCKKSGRPPGVKTKPKSPEAAKAFDAGYNSISSGSILDRVKHSLHVSMATLGGTDVSVPTADLHAVLDFVCCASGAAMGRTFDRARFEQLLRAIEETPEQTKKRKQEAFQKKLEAFKLMTPEQKRQQVLDTLAERGESIEDFFKRLTAPVEE